MACFWECARASGQRWAPALAAALVTGACLVAQPRPAWAVLSPGAPINTSLIQQLGKLVIYEEPATVHVFSAFTRRWHSTPRPAGASLRHANDWLLLRAGGAFTVFSSMRGVFETRSFSPQAVVLNPASQRNDSLLLIEDAGVLHAFSGLTGVWTQIPLGPSAQVAVEGHTAVVVDGGIAAAQSAYGGGWQPQAIVGTPRRVHASGTVAVVETEVAVFGYSAAQRGWSQTGAPAPGAVFASGDDVALWESAGTALGFSGVRGAFATAAVEPGAGLVAEQQLGAAVGGSAVDFFSAPRAQWTEVPRPPGAAVMSSAAVAAVLDTTGVRAYSAVTGGAVFQAARQAFVGVSWTVAALQDGVNQQSWFFSAFSGAWHAAPAGPVAAFPRVAFNGGLIEANGGFAAFSARDGNFVFTSAGPGSVPHVDPQSGLLAVEEPAGLSVFEPRRRVWVRAPVAGGGLVVQQWRTALLAEQGTRVWGFGSQDGTVHPHDVGAAVIDTKASSESLRVVTAAEIHAFSPLPDVLPLTQFPEFRRMLAGGAPLDVVISADSGAVVAPVGGLPATAPVPVVGLSGLLLLAPPLVPLPPLIAGADGRAALSVPVPAAPTLVGLTLGLQALVVPAVRAPYLTGLGAATPF